MVCGPSSLMMNFSGLRQISKWIPSLRQRFFLHYIAFQNQACIVRVRGPGTNEPQVEIRT